MHSLTPDFLSGLRYNGLQIATLRSLGELRGKQQLFVAHRPRILKGLKQLAAIESSESSNRLEGVVVASGRLKSLIMKNAEPKTRSEQEVAGYRDALALIHEAAAVSPLSEGIIQQLNNMLCRYLPQEENYGKATTNNTIDCPPAGSSTVGSHPLEGHFRPMAMADTIIRYQTALDQNLADPLVLVPLSILDFLCIHPFSDGHGRVARLLTLLLLYQLDYSVGRFISIERIFEDSKESYYRTLETSSQGWHEGEHDVQPWLNYFWGALLRAYKEFEVRVGTIDYLPRGKSARVRAEALKRTGLFSISEIEKSCPGVSRDTVRLVLRSLKAGGLIEPTGKGRNAKWKKLSSMHSTPSDCPATTALILTPPRETHE
ncbi:Fic family protein [Pseudomonas sp. KU26590]|uniref:Fic family protein n=1 Tax=Pseudomonas sp. KU26590 TaxID=2991051 RepID=UPI00223CC4BA|nr:Fic family protein [Pseudomonas sp. KU26590]UZJ60896.1 Fic family protein [Pseudomonas sp. KU26590]